MRTTIKTAVVGGNGYTGAELTRLLFFHPRVESVRALSRNDAGLPLYRRIPALRGVSDAVFEDFDAPITECDAVFFATPPGVAMKQTAALLQNGAVVIDLSPDFRLRDVAVFEKWYGRHESPQLLTESVYGLTETARTELQTATLIACPGCFATAVALSLIPFAAFAAGTVVADAKSGVSGGGRRPDRDDLLFAEMAANFKPYAVDGHRHQPEIEQTVAPFGDGGVCPPLVFVPHLLPTVRGIYANVYIPLRQKVDGLAVLQKHWAGEPFIECLSEVPELANVVGANKVHIGCSLLSDKMLLVMTALDNLIKGAAGQAVQNMNVRFGFGETTGLGAPAR